MLLPKKTKYRKVRKGKNDGIASRGQYIAFGDYGLPVVKLKPHVKL